jgi:hypothetical protein
MRCARCLCRADARVGGDASEGVPPAGVAPSSAARPPPQLAGAPSRPRSTGAAAGSGSGRAAAAASPLAPQPDCAPAAARRTAALAASNSCEGANSTQGGLLPRTRSARLSKESASSSCTDVLALQLWLSNTAMQGTGQAQRQHALRRGSVLNMRPAPHGHIALWA